MISVVVPTLNAERTIGGALAALMTAVVDGLVREVIVADGGSTDATLEVAEDAGTGILRLSGDRGALLAAGCAAARSAWIMTLPIESRMLWGWEEVVADHLEASPGQGAWFPLTPGGLFQKLRAPRDGVALLMPRRLYDQAGGFAAGSAEGRLARRLGKLSRLPVPYLAPKTLKR